jgi:hypothetical protein
MVNTLGRLGVAHEAPPADVDCPTFEWVDGKTYRVVAQINEVELVDFMHAARSMSEDDPAALATMRDGFEMVIHPADFAEFWKAARVHRQTLEEMGAVFQVLVEAATARPTQQQFASSTGPRGIPANSPAGSSSPESSGVVAVARPDLQVIREDAAAVQERMLRASG